VARVVSAIIGCFALCAVTGVAALSQFNAAGPAVALPRTFDGLAVWLTTRPNPWLVLNIMISAVTLVLGSWAALAQLHAPPAATDADMKMLLAKIAAMEQRLSEDIGISPAEAEQFGSTVRELARSDDPLSRSAAEEIVNGDPVSAAQRLLEEAQTDHVERARQAARILAPFAPAKAMEAYARIVELDPTASWAWIELGRLRAIYLSLAEARRCFEAALQYVTDDLNRCILDLDLGNLALAAGDLAEAQSRFSAVLATTERMLSQEGNDRDWYERQFMVSNAKLGDVAAEFEDYVEASARYEASLPIAERRAERESDVVEWQRDLAVTHLRLGDFAEKVGNWKEAKHRYQKFHVFAEDAWRRHPKDVSLQGDVATSNLRLGEVTTGLGEIRQARRHYQRASELLADLNAREPGNADWRRAISIAKNHLGAMEMLEGNVRPAQTLYEEALAITEDLLEANAERVELQNDAFIVLVRLAQIAEYTNDRALALARFRTAEKLMEAVGERLPGHPIVARSLAEVRAELARLRALP